LGDFDFAEVDSLNIKVLAIARKGASKVLWNVKST
jgi:hypothetical protein